MDLLNNPLANMAGPYYLLFYGALLAILSFIARHMRKSLDPSSQLAPLPMPEAPNPFEIAFLRGGTNEVARLLVVELFHRGVLVETPKSLLQKSKLKLADNVDLESLDPSLQKLARLFSVPRDPNALTSKNVQDIFGKQVEYCSNWVHEQQLVFEQSQRRASRVATGYLIGVFLAVGIYKLAIALAKNHNNFVFLLMLASFGAFAIFAILRLPKFTARGKRYLEDLQTAYASFRSSTLPKPGEVEPQPASAAAWDPLLVGSYAMPVMVMGLFGASALQSSYYQTLRDRFVGQSAGATCSGCGAGCGSSCGGGAGGCSGGCGGGGCGGCGS